MKTRHFISLISLLLSTSVLSAQAGFSTASDFGLQFNLRKTQQFTAVGFSLQTIFHVNQKNAGYVCFGLYSNGKYSNKLSATAKQPGTIPQQVIYNDTSKMQLKEFSIGWRWYLKGKADNPKSWNLYSCAGLGLMFGRIENYAKTVPDTSIYQLPILHGRGSFKRLTVDLALGGEIPLGGDVYFYTDLRTWIPTSSYPSKYLLVNNDAPWILLVCSGIRIYF